MTYGFQKLMGSMIKTLYNGMGVTRSFSVILWKKKRLLIDSLTRNYGQCDSLFWSDVLPSFSVMDLSNRKHMEPNPIATELES
jgi:hypothetical protein